MATESEYKENPISIIPGKLGRVSHGRIDESMRSRKVR